jgi:hypothetical protein
MHINRVRMGDNAEVDMMASIRKGKLNDARLNMRHQVLSSFRLKEQQECPICLLEFTPGDKISVLGCNKLHFMHEDCIKTLIDFRKEKDRKNAKCPMCRVEIDANAIVVRDYAGLEKVELDDIKVD